MSDSQQPPNIPELHGTDFGLVPLDDPDFPDRFLLFGDPDVGSGPLKRENLLFTAGKGASAANTAAQAVEGYANAAHLVKLAPETVAQIRAGAQVVKVGGLNAGVLRAADTGKFVGQVKWLPAGATVSTVASVTSAVTMAAIQMQLAAISKSIEDVGRRVARVEDWQRNEQLSELLSLVRSVQQYRKMAVAAGAVSRKIQGLNSQMGSKLDKQVIRLQRECRRHLSSLEGATTRKARIQWLHEEADQVAEDILALVYAGEAWAESRILDAAHLNDSEGDTQAETGANTEAALVVLRDLRTRRADNTRLLRQLVYEFDRALELAEISLSAVPLRGRLSQGLFHAQDAVASLPAKLRERVRGVVSDIPQVPSLPSVQVVGYDADPEQYGWRRVLPLLLRSGEVVQALVFGQSLVRSRSVASNPIDRPAVIVVTDSRVMGFTKKALATKGSVLFDLPHEQIHGVHAPGLLSGRSLLRFPLNGFSPSPVKPFWPGEILRIVEKRGFKHLHGGITWDMEMPVGEATRAATLIRSVTEDRQMLESAAFGPEWLDHQYDAVEDESTVSPMPMSVSAD